MKLSKESKIGFTIVLALGFLYWGIHYLRGLNLLKPNNSYYVCFTHVDGLTKSAPVNLDGFQVGVVEDIRYRYDRPGNIVVKLTLDRQLKLPDNSQALLTPALMGSPTITLQPGDSPSYAAHGDTLAASYGEGLLEQLSEALLPELETTVRRLNTILSELEGELSDSGDLHTAFRELSRTGTHLKSLSCNLEQMARKDLPPILSHIHTLSGELSSVGQNLSRIDFAGSMNRVDNCLTGVETVLDQLNRTDNSLGLLLNDSSIHFHINQTVQSANELLLDLKSHPKRYVHFSLFGNKNE